MILWPRWKRFYSSWPTIGIGWNSCGAKEWLMFGNASLGMQRRSLPLGFCNGQSSKAQNQTFHRQRGCNRCPWQILRSEARQSGAEIDLRAREVPTVTNPFDDEPTAL